MNRPLYYGCQCIEEDDIKAVMEVLRSNFLTQGPKVREFENRLAEYCGARYAVAFSSGTAALHGAYFSAGVGEGDEIITSPITFMATANAALFLAARPAFIDVEVDTGNMEPSLVEEAITEKTKAVVPVHFSGHPVDLAGISKTAKEHKLLLIEDACHALGAKYLDTTIGDCSYSDMCVFSFHPVKSITTAEGGAVLTNNESLYEKLVMFRQHGVTKDERKLRNKSDEDGPWYHEMHYLGYNYRLTDIQSALGISQLGKLDRFVARRREIVDIYARGFEDNPFFDLPVERNYAKSAYHLYAIRLKDAHSSRKKAIFAELKNRGIVAQVHYIPVHLQPYYQDLGYKRGAYSVAEDFYERVLSLPLYPSMSQEDVEFVIDRTLAAFREA